MKGLFLALEGVDGAGKTTQVERLAARLEESGRRTLCVREPGGTPLGEAVREILLSRNDLSMSAEAELLLFLASRVELYEQKIAPALASDVVVISDRYHLSTIVYQGIARGLGEERVAEICAQVLGDRRPNLQVVLELSLAECEIRIGEERDRIESDREMLARVVDGFQHTSGLPGDRILRVDGGADPETVANAVWKVVEGAL